MRSNELVRRLMTEAVLSIEIRETAREALRQFADIQCIIGRSSMTVDT
jgi:hypothetical protein